MLVDQPCYRNPDYGINGIDKGFFERHEVRQIILMILLAVVSCKPYARSPQGMIKASSGSEKFTLKLERDGDGGVLSACPMDTGTPKTCRNLLLTKDGKAPYRFFGMDAVLHKIEKNSKKRSLIRRGLLLGAASLAAGLTVLGFKRLHKLEIKLQHIDELKTKLHEYVDSRLHHEYTPEEIKRIRDKLTKLIDNNEEATALLNKQMGSEDAATYREALTKALDNANITSGIMDMEDMFKKSKGTISFLRPALIAGMVGVPSTLVGNFVVDMVEDRKLQEQSEHILALFSEQSKEITLSLAEVNELLKIFSQYLPAKIDAEWLASAA